MTTIDNILALADEHASQWDNGRENSHIAREALRTALTEALAQPIDTSPEGGEKSGGNVQVQPVALNWRELVAWWESGAEQWDGLRDIVNKMIQARSAQQAEQDEVGINGLTDAETRATMSVMGLSEPTKLTAYERKCFNDWKNP